MKNKLTIPVLLYLILVSCGEDRRTEYLAITAPDRWIDGVMRENYYWYEEMPDGGSLNYFTEASAFFNKLRSNKDQISYLEDPGDMESRKSYGITFYAHAYNDTAYALKVLHVDADSPAQEAGLERGDWIIKRNNAYILRNRIDSLYKGSPSTITRGVYKVEYDENEEKIAEFEDKDVVKLGAARITSDNPITYAGVYTTDEGKNVGYLAYKYFASGINGNDTYNQALRQISNAVKSENPDEFILDLRYNEGGELKAAQLLGSILAPQEALGQPMLHLKYNNKQADRDTTWLFSNEALGSGSNLNLSRLYVIVDANTASTSEVLINALKAYMDVTLIGQATKGIFAKTHPYATSEYPYILHLVDCMIYDANDKQPTSGYTPNYSINELQYVDTYSIGSVNEVVLAATLHLIDYGTIPE